MAAAQASGLAPPAVSVPVGFTTFPGEIWAAPRSWVEAVYPGVTYFNEVDRGGHFAAWEDAGSSSPPTCGLHSAHCANDAICVRLSTGGGSMPTQTLILFLLDLEDVGRTSELAESDLRRERLMGFEPTTFCMASRADEHDG